MRNLFKFTENEKTKKFLGAGFSVSLAGLAIGGLMIHGHGELKLSEVPLIYPGIGFLGCLILIYAAKGLAVVLRRDENYYDK